MIFVPIFSISVLKNLDQLNSGVVRASTPFSIIVAKALRMRLALCAREKVSVKKIGSKKRQLT